MGPRRQGSVPFAMLVAGLSDGATLSWQLDIAAEGHASHVLVADTDAVAGGISPQVGLVGRDG